MTIIEKIRAEIERLKGIGGIVPLDNREQKTGYESALIDIETFLDTLQEPSIEDCADALLNALSKSPYNNKPITDAQVIVKELLVFIKEPNKYNPDAILQEPEVDLNGKVTFDNKTILRVETDEKKKRVLEIIGLEESCCNYPLNYENETDDCYYEEYNDRIYIDGNITFNQMRVLFPKMSLRKGTIFRSKSSTKKFLNDIWRQRNELYTTIIKSRRMDTLKNDYHLR